MRLLTSLIVSGLAGGVGVLGIGAAVSTFTWAAGYHPMAFVVGVAGGTIVAMVLLWMALE